jgi:2-polyprenyl-6-methoxyphenol hydroxylase-like FAD-dependent oxidoreductase
MPDRASLHVGIVGGGPAGLATALALRAGCPELAITVMHRNRPGSVRATETLPPIAQPLLHQLQVWDRFLQAGHRPSYGATASWGHGGIDENHFLFHPYSRGWNVDRRRFDQMLFETVLDRGIRVVENGSGNPVVGWSNLGCRMVMGAEQSPLSSVEVDWIVDATGRSAVWARQWGARREFTDRLVAVVRTFQVSHAADLPDRRSFVEAVETGWWSLGWAPDGTAIVAFMTDDDLARSLNLREASAWDAHLQDTTHLCRRLEPSTPLSVPSLQAAQSACLDQVSGERWLAVGDAASSLDPLTSMGVFKALRSGIFASYALRNAMEGDRTGFVRYEKLMRAEYDGYLKGRAMFYGQERRWSDSPFWRRRGAGRAESRATLMSSWKSFPERVPALEPLGV